MKLINEHDLLMILVDRGLQTYGLADGLESFKRSVLGCTDADQKQIDVNTFMNVYSRRNFEWRTETGDDMTITFDIMTVFELTRADEDHIYQGTFFYIY